MKGTQITRLLVIFMGMVALAGCDLLQGPPGPEGPAGPPGQDGTAGPADVIGTVDIVAYAGPPRAVNYKGNNYYVLLDDDTDPTNGAVEEFQNTVPGTSGSTPFTAALSYQMIDAAAGNYYLFVYIDSNGNGSWDSGQDPANYFGIDDQDFANDPSLRPDAVNVNIPESGYVDFDVVLSEVAS